ncbi:MAG: aromatic ring-hydroxylating dioxygenase subunit alpha [Planctomycetaceae bacterium]
MFVNKEHLPQVLTSDDYKCPKHFEREMETMFLPSWQIVATKADLPNDGDFLTLELLGQPLIIWNSGGTYHTFLNVCPHRFSRIKGEARGCSPNRLQCQYHAWEFDDTGNTRKIPDAPSFKPMTQGALGLKKYRTETCGQVICVNLTDEGPSLKEYLGEVYDVAFEYCSEDRMFAATFEFEYDVNWKIKVENSCETYHLSQVHKKTFGQTPDQEMCFHELHPRWTAFTIYQPAGRPLHRRLDDLTHRLAHTKNNNEFRHYIVYPYLMFGRARLFTWAEAIHPISATRTRNVIHLFSHKSRSGKLSSRILCKILAAWGKRYTYQAAMEDLGVIKEVQAGHMSTRRPSEGVVSIREERCFHFQEYVKNATRPHEENGRGNGRSPGLEVSTPSAPATLEAEAT